MDCLSCRQRYSDKFWNSEQWLLSREPAEQASDSRIARWRAQILAGTGSSDLVELGCGLGGDTVFLSKHFQLTALEKCPARCELARYNLSHLGTQGSEVVHRDMECSDLKGEALFVDPARRSAGRLSRPEDWHPSLGDVVSCFLEGRFRTVGVKCAPGLLDADLPEAPTSLFFLSVEGQMKEAFLLMNERSERLRVAVLFSDSSQPQTFISLGREIPIASPSNECYLHNPDPAILRAGALDALAEQLESGIVHPKIGYLVGPKPSPDKAASSFRVLEHFPLRWKTLKKKLSTMGWSDYEYLGRGVPFGQSEVRSKLGRLKRKKGRPPVRGSVIIYRNDSGYTTVLGARC
jgi:hypothetical protein